MHNVDLVKTTILIHWPGIDSAIVNEIGSIVKEMSNGISFLDNVVTLSSSSMSEFLVSKDSIEALDNLKKHIGEVNFDEIYYAHDIEGGLFQFLCAAYPNAKRICFGDALGNVYEKEVHLSFLRGQPTQVISKLTFKSKIKKTIEKVNKLAKPAIKGKTNLILKEFKPNGAALILPVDQSGNFLRNTPLTVCKKETLMEVLETCISNSKNLQVYIREIIQKYKNRKLFLLLTDNLAEGNFINFDREIDMYCSIIKEYCGQESVVFLKSHPGETLPRNKKIKEALVGKYEIVELDKKFKRYPIELFRELVTNCKVICMSYPVLSLKYLYDVDVIQPMDSAFIEKWFPRWTWASYKNSLSLYMKPLNNLSKWNGEDILWSGRH